MTDSTRRSPVVFNKKAAKKEIRGNWVVVQEYENEGKSPCLIDLSHLTRWDLQDGELDRFKPWGITIPDAPGSVVLGNDKLVSRMNRTQAAVWILNDNGDTDPDDPAAYTETTDVTACLGLIGKNIISIAEKVSALDFSVPEKSELSLFQGPFQHVPCQIVLVDKFSEDAGLFFTCSRGYARDMVDGLLEAGREFQLEPAGESIFRSWLRGRK